MTTLTKILIIACLFASTAHGQEPNLKVWIQEYEAKRRQGSVDLGLYTRNILAVKSFKLRTPPKLRKFYEINGYGILKSVDHSSLQMYFKLNRRPRNILTIKQRARPKKSSEEWISELFYPTGADTIFDSSGGEWTAYFLKNDELVEIFSDNPPNPINKKSFAKWMETNLGYDGVVLDARGDFILVGSFSPLKRKSSQALIYRDSSQTLRIENSKTENQGLALIQLVRTHRSFSIFKLLLGLKSGTVVPIGSKIALEK